MSVLIFFLAGYVLTCLTLTKLFEKAGVAPSKAWTPVVNIREWCNLIGKPQREGWWLLFPIVNLFTWTGMAVDLARSFGYRRFWHAALAVIFSPIIFWIIGSDKNAKYQGKILEQEADYLQKMQEAYDRKDKIMLQRLERDNPFKKGGAREWVEAAVFAVFAASFIRMFLIEAYVIPSSSMEGSLKIGDYLFVSKWHYGIRTPQTVLQLPLVHNEAPFVGGNSYLETPKLPYFRLPAWQNIERNDPIVFNWPAGDSIIPNAAKDYMFTAHEIRVSNGELKGNELLKRLLVTRPADKREHYVKRCVGIAGDTLEIRNKQVYINGALLPLPPNAQFSYDLSSFYNERMGEIERRKILADLDKMGVNVAEAKNETRFYLNQATADALKAQGKQPKQLDGKFPDPMLRFPHDTVNFKGWDLDNFGPIWIPKAGATVNLTMENISLYLRIIGVYENNKLELRDGKIYINGAESTSYTFKQDYFWMMGDNRHMSQDSRYWGFVPRDHVVGKPLFIFFSLKNGALRNGILWNRFFKSAYQM